MIGNRLDLQRSRPVPLSRRAPDGRNHLCLRGGMTLFEVLAAVAVLGVLLIACAQMLAVMTVQQAGGQNRHASNGTERHGAITRRSPGKRRRTSPTNHSRGHGQGMLRDAGGDRR